MLRWFLALTSLLRRPPVGYEPSLEEFTSFWRTMGGGTLLFVVLMALFAGLSACVVWDVSSKGEISTTKPVLTVTEEVGDFPMPTGSLPG